MSDQSMEVEVVDSDDVLKLTPELIHNVMRLGRVMQYASEPMTDDAHIAGFIKLVEDTRQTHGQAMDECNSAYGLRLAVFNPLQVAYIGFSPNAPSVSETLALAWNRLVRDCEDILSQQEIIESRRAGQEA